MRSALLTGWTRFGIFSKGRGPPELQKPSAVAAKDVKPSESSAGESAGLMERGAEPAAAEDGAVTAVDSTQPSYFGYLSGVVTSLWNPAQQKKLEDGEMLVTSPPVKERRTKIVVKRVSRTEVVNRTKQHVQKLLAAQTSAERLQCINEFSQHLSEFPASRLVAVQQSPELVAHLLEEEDAADEAVRAAARRCLALCGYVRPPKGAGIRLLSIDGGGTRGMMGLEVLAELEQNLGTRICEHFDLICGVSTGAIISVLLGAKQMRVQEAKEIYRDISQQLFSQGKLSGVSGLLLSHSYYNTKKWVEILKRTLGEEPIIDTALQPAAAKIAIVSCIVNAPQLQPFVFRNYEHPAGRDSHFRGGTQHKLWQAIQASAAAPGYFEEVSLGTVLHQDGGVLANNPTAIALHEARLLWPREAVQCVVSVGNGRTVSELELSSTLRNTGIQDKISKIVDSATDTELVHNAMSDLLPAHSYFRLNPYMSTPYTLDEIDPGRLEQMVADARSYVRRNRQKILEAALQLSRPPPLWRMASRALDSVKHANGLYSPC